MKKKTAAILAVLMLVVLAVTGCGKDKKDPILGKWEATKVRVSDVEVTMDAFLAELGDSTMKMSLEFFEDGSVNSSIMGEEGEGIWEANEDGTYTLSDETEDMDIELEGEELALTYSEIQLVFEKSK